MSILVQNEPALLSTVCRLIRAMSWQSVEILASEIEFNRAKGAIESRRAVTGRMLVDATIAAEEKRP